MMSKISDKLKLLGLSSNEALIYLLLLEKGSKTALEVSRDTKLARTKVYRIIESLTERQFVVRHVDNRGARFSAAPPYSLESVLETEQAKLDQKKAELAVLIPELEKQEHLAQESSHVKFYRGIDGLKQVTWNSLKAKGELLVYEISNLDEFIPEHGYAEDLRRRFVKNKVMTRNLVNKKSFDEWTNVTEMVEKYWEARHIPLEILSIDSEILVYNNVYAMYRFQGDDIFCVEVYNQELADMQRQIFEVLWSMSKPFVVENEFGKSRLKKGK